MVDADDPKDVHVLIPAAVDVSHHMWREIITLGRPGGTVSSQCHQGVLLGEEGGRGISERRQAARVAQEARNLEKLG